MGENLIGTYSNNYHYKPEICHQRGKKKKYTCDGQSYSMRCSKKERKNKGKTYWLKYFCCRLASMKLIVQAAVTASLENSMQPWTHIKKNQNQTTNKTPNKSTKMWITAATWVEEGHSEGQRLSVMLGVIGKSLACSLWQSKICMRLERLF